MAEELKKAVIWDADDEPVPGPSGSAAGRPIPLPAGNGAPAEEATAGETRTVVSEPASSGAEAEGESPQSSDGRADGSDSDDEPFEVPGIEKVGIVGGTRTGKSYLFQSMVYRTLAGPQSGALTYYLNGIRLSSALRRSDRARTVYVTEFVKKYCSWQRLAPTLHDTQRWYRLRMKCRTGILGGSESKLDVEFFDGAGELFQGPRNAASREVWKQGY
ncbi:MAG TPA: hypothetical protein VFS60_00895, partial [Thermoanaerobaculia bacterium]|nr:hypothetical protein [Thermoanaerobaculia bacterium]